MNIPDEELMLRFQSGDKSALGTVYKRYQKSLTMYIYKSVHDMQVAEDLLHETFIKVMKHPRSYNPEHSVYSFLVLIAKQRIITRFHKNNAEKRKGIEITINGEISLQIDSGQQNPEQILEGKTEVESIIKELRQLPKTHQQAIELNCYQGMEYEEISKLLNIPIGTVKSRIHRARKALCKSKTIG